MSKRRKNQFREALDAKREALASAAKQPKPEPEWEPESPELSAEVLADRLEERETELAKEQERRRAAEMAWSTRFEVDYGLRWDHERRVWASSAEDGFTYDGQRRTA